MTLRGRRAGKKRVVPPVSHEGSGRRDIIPLNTSTIRNKALKDYEKTERDLEKLRADLKRYHEKDIPGFRSWFHDRFGRELTRFREVQAEADVLRSKLSETYDLAERLNLSLGEAYVKMLWRREHPQEAEEEDRRLEEAERARAEARRQKAEERGEGGDDGWDPFDDLDEFDEEFSDEEEEKAFQQFFEEMTGARRPARHARGAVNGEAARSAKEVYRTIVRLLHPDHHGQMTPVQRELWHEAQTAYRKGDVNALYRVLARCDSGAAGVGKHTAVSVIRALVSQMKASVREARAEIRGVKRDPAWDYARRIEDIRYVRQLGDSVLADIHMAREDLRNLTETLADLEELARRESRPRSRGRQQKRRRPMEDEDFDLPF